MTEKYKYFKAVEDTEHYLSASEIAQIVMDKLKWTTREGKPPIRYVSSYLKHNTSEEFYYFTKKGPMRVYSINQYYPMFIRMQCSNKNYLEFNDGKNTYFAIRKKRNNRHEHK